MSIFLWFTVSWCVIVGAFCILFKSYFYNHREVIQLRLIASYILYSVNMFNSLGPSDAYMRQ